MKKLSILTINYNNSSGLKSTLESITQQVIPEEFTFEVNIVDGLSTDDSINVLESYRHIINKLVCEKDNGIYDAMNKGIDLADAEYLLFLNSGDYFSTPNAFNIIHNTLKKIKNTETTIFWPVRNITENGDFWFYPNENIRNISDWLKNNTPNHQAMLFPRKFYSKNKYNLSYIIASDHDYKYRCIKENGFLFIKNSITDFLIGGISSAPLDFKRYKILLKDSYLFYNNNYKGFSKVANKLKDTIKLSIKLLISLSLKKYYLYIIRKIKGYK